MTAKLTLSIEKETIAKAKVLSAKSGKSISKMVEEYLDKIAGTGQKNGSAVDRLCGSVKSILPEEKSWKEIKADYLKDKYGL